MYSGSLDVERNISQKSDRHLFGKLIVKSRLMRSDERLLTRIQFENDVYL